MHKSAKPSCSLLCGIRVVFSSRLMIFSSSRRGSSIESAAGRAFIIDEVRRDQIKEEPNNIEIDS